MEILVVDYGMNEDTVVLGFINSSGEVEYTIYHRGDGGTIEIEDETNLDSIGAILAEEADITEYQDYTLKEVE
jgi:hypothetical protein